MKVLHVTYDMRIGGTEMVIKNLVEGNKNNDIEMSIFCIESPLGPWGESLKSMGIEIDGRDRQPGFDTSLIKAIRTHIKENHIDVVHCHQYTPWVYGTLAAAFTSTKVIFTEHGRFYPDSSSWKRRFVNPILSGLTSSVVAISKATKDALVNFEYISPTKIDVVYNGIKPMLPSQSDTSQLRSKLNLPENAIVFGTVARLDPIKNQSMLIRAFSKVCTSIPNTYLLIVGDGELMGDLQSLANDLGLNQKVIFTGYEPYPANYMALMNVFMLPSLSEGTSITLLEAMSMGTPCIVTNAGGNPEIVAHNENGLVVENNNETELCQAMIEISESSELYDTLAKNAKPRFEKLFHLNNMVNTYIDIYKNIAK